MTPSLTTMGFTVHLHEGCLPLVHTQPSGLTSSWHLKYTMTLQTPHNYAHKRISSIIVGAVLNVLPFLHTWMSCLLNITAWAQVACLSGISRSTVLRVLHYAVPRIISRTPWDLDPSMVLPRNVYFAHHTRHYIFWAAPLSAAARSLVRTSLRLLAHATRRNLQRFLCRLVPLFSCSQLSYPAIGPIYSNPLGA